MWHRPEVPAARKRELAQQAIELYEAIGKEDQVEDMRELLAKLEAGEVGKVRPVLVTSLD